MSIKWQLFLFGLILSISISAAADDAGKCTVCESSDEKCTNDPGSIIPISCPDTTKQCFTLVENNGKIKRGCVSDTNKCDGKNCLPCDIATSNCNNAAAKDIFTCKNCDSSTNAVCSTWSDADAITNEICKGEKKCLMQINGKTTERRCVSTGDTTGENRQICETSGCNKDVFPNDRRICYQCAESDEKCANPVANGILALPCTQYDKDDQCYTYASSEKAMNRGCTSDTTAFTKCQAVNDKCSKCGGNNCNNLPFKKVQSVTCVQCAESDAACAWGHADSEAKTCANQIEYWQTEGCYTHKLDGNKAARGCLNDVPKTLDCSAGSTTCTTCNASACNKADVMEYTCYKCRSDENPSCAKKLEGDSYKPEKCRNPVTQADQGCYTERWNNIIIRSCLVDADNKTQANCKDSKYKKCDHCEEANCNKNDPPNGSPKSIALGSGLLALAFLVSRFL